MIRAVVALLLITTLGCFPHNPKARTYAQIGEGAAILAGIAVAATAGTGADCDEMQAPGTDTSDCKSRAKLLSGIGVALIVGGLLGFVATISTAVEEKPTPEAIKQETATPAPMPVAAPPPPTTEPNATGSAADPAAVGSAAPTDAGSAAPTTPTP